MYNRVKLLFMHFSPWSLIHAVSVPVALYSLWRARFWRTNDLGSDERRLMNRALLSALYLGWLAEATFLQNPFPYAHAPALILALAVLTAHRWPVG